MIKGTLDQKFKDGDMVHVVFVEGYGWFVSQEAFDELKLQIETEDSVDGIVGINLTVSKFLPYEYHEPKLEKPSE